MMPCRKLSYRLELDAFGRTGVGPCDNFNACNSLLSRSSSEYGVFVCDAKSPKYGDELSDDGCFLLTTMSFTLKFTLGLFLGGSKK